MAPDATADGPPDAGGSRAATPHPPESVARAAAPRRRDWPALAALGVVSAVWTATYLRHSFRYGRLGFPPLYDDVTYLLDGARRIAGIREDGVVGFVKSLIEYPPKSLIATIHATGAFLIFGVRDWAPYLFNVFVIFAILASAEWAMRGHAGPEERARAPRPLPVWPRVGACLLLLGCPMLGRAVNEFRPDFFAAFALAVAAFAMIDRPLKGSSAPRLLGLGFLVGVSITGKPTATPAVIVLAGLAFGVGLGIDLARTPAGERAARAAPVVGWLAAGALVLPLLYIPFGAESTWNYVKANLFGPSARLWTPELTPREGFLYYITGAGGQYMLGYYALPLLGLALFGLGCRAKSGGREERWRTLGLVALLGASWAVPTLTPIKHGLFGLQFDAMLVLFAARGLRDALASLMLVSRVPLAIPLALTTAGASVGLAAIKLGAKPVNARSPRIQEVHALYGRIYDAVRARAASDGARCDVFLTFTGFINRSNLEYRATLDGRPIRFESREGVDRPEKYEQHLDGAELVLALAPGTGHEVGRFPSLKVLDESIDFLDAHPGFERVAEFPVKHLRTGVDAPGRHPPGYILYARRAGVQPTESMPAPDGAPPP